MATYNGERYLRAQLESLRAQTAPPAELVVCDDGSTDATLEILEAFRADAPFPVEVHRSERNRGYVDTFLRAVGACRSDWVAFCDQDDVWLDHKLARVTEVLTRHPEIWLVSHSAEQVDADLRPFGSRFPHHRTFAVRGPLRSAPLGIYPGFTCCVRRAMFEPRLIESRPINPKAPGGLQTHDEFIYNVANTYGHIATLPDVLALYRRHPGALTATKDAPVYHVSARARLKATLRATAEGYRQRRHVVVAHRRQYEQVLRTLGGRDGGSGVGVRPTRDAVAYYGRLAAALERRAALYAESASFAERARAFAGNVVRKAYRMGPEGGGLGMRALAKDLVCVVVPVLPS